MNTITIRDGNGTDIELPVGCWIDCHKGIYIGEEVQEIATAYGWKGECVACDGVLSDGDDPEAYEWAWEEAEEFMNSLIEEHDFYFTCSDWGGDWGLWPIEED